MFYDPWITLNACYLYHEGVVHSLRLDGRREYKNAMDVEVPSA